jgi:CDP-glucose 4,6-dehydratase
MTDLSFYRGKRVLITGHSGFKGAWMSEVLLKAGADVTGYALEPPTEPSLFRLLSLDSKINSIKGDIRDLETLKKTFDEVRPEIVIHMAAQPIVRESYQSPVYTYEVNVMGTVNVLESIRLSDSVKSFVNVTTDKVYKNKEWEWGYRENEELNGYDPYSNSKSCSELVTESYRNSFFADRETAISTMRAGNVIGGGDFASDRIIPDCVRAASEKKDIIVRNPYSTRPYQHVLEPVMAYLMVAERQYMDKKLVGSYNVGPDEADCWTTGRLVSLFCEQWNEMMKADIAWRNVSDKGPHEAGFLKLDCSKIKRVFDWRPRWNVEEAMRKIMEWNQEYFGGGDVCGVVDQQIEDYIKGR